MAGDRVNDLRWMAAALYATVRGLLINTSQLKKVKTPASYTFAELFEGQEASFEVVVSDNDLDRFADLSGDFSAIHVSRDCAIEKGFPNRVAHGMLAGAFVSRLIGVQLPGNNGLLQTMQLKFHRPFFPGDILLVHGRLREKHDSVRAVTIDVKVTRNEEVLVSAKVQSGITA